MGRSPVEELFSTGEYNLIKISKREKDTIRLETGAGRSSILIDDNKVTNRAWVIAYFGENPDNHGYPGYISKWTGKYVTPSIHTRQCITARNGLKSYGLFDFQANPTEEMKKLGEFLLPLVINYNSLKNKK
jgi:hypothetical protein